MMQPKTVVFFGISGAGKGTQIHLLRKFLEEKDVMRHALHFDMGVGLREMAQTPTMLAVKVKKIMAEGGLVPSFVCSYVLTDFLVRSFARTVVRELGLDRWPELREDYFHGYTRVVWLAQEPDAELRVLAADAAVTLGLPLTVVETGHDGLERALADLVAG